MPELILASGSSARRKMLEAAGVAFRVAPAAVDEDAERGRLGSASPRQVALHLARAKAAEVSLRHPEAVVIGADQVLALAGRIFTKASNLAEARIALQSLAGRTHALHSAVALAIGGGIVWHRVDDAALTMRAFSQAFADDYLERAGERVCASVGCYELEGLGIQLFEHIEGDYFTILGMPLLPLLAELRRHGALAA